MHEETSKTFRNIDFTKKVVAKFGGTQDSVKVKMRYTEAVQTFLRKIEEAHEKAATSKLTFK